MGTHGSGSTFGSRNRAAKLEASPATKARAMMIFDIPFFFLSYIPSSFFGSRRYLEASASMIFLKNSFWVFVPSDA